MNSSERELFSKGGKNMNRHLLSVGKHIFKMHDKFCEKISSKYSLTNLELNILFFLKSNLGLDTAKEMLEKLNLSKSNISDAVDSLTKKGYLTGIQDEKDRRYIHLKLTNEAEVVLEDAFDTNDKFFEAMTEGIPQEKIDITREVLEQILTNVIKEAEKV